MPGLPARYRWLAAEPGPKIVIEALKEYGTAEVAGRADNPKILAWSREVGAPSWYVHDQIPWCGLFVAVCAHRAGKKPPAAMLSALAWSNFGTHVARSGAMLGDVLVFTRKGGGHVGIYVGEDSVAFHVLGGNQSNAVNIKRVGKSRLYAVRRCEWRVAQPPNVRKIILSASGVLSHNEA